MIATAADALHILMVMRGAAGVFLFALALCLLMAGGHLYSPDEEIMFRMTESMATRGRLDVAPIMGPNGDTFATRRGINGLEYPQYGMANSVVAVPLYWAGSLACKIIPSASAEHFLNFKTQLHIDDGPDKGHQLLRRFVVSFTGSIIAALTAMMIYMFCRRLPELEFGDNTGYGNRACWLVAMAYIAGTMALPHARTFFSEPLATLFILWTFYLLAMPVNRPLTVMRSLAAGCAMALALATRLDSLFAAGGLGLVLLWKLPAVRNTAGESADDSGFQVAMRWLSSRVTAANFGRIAMFTVPVALFFTWQLIMNWLRFGNPFSSAYADQPEGINFSTPLLAGLYGFLFSIGKSLILFSPALLLAMFGVARFYRQHPMLTAGLLLSCLGVLLVHASWQNWAGGWCWGPRHIFMVHALLIIPAVAFLDRPGTARRLLAEAVLLIGFLVQVYGSSQNFIDYYLLYYRTPYEPPNARVMYGGEDLAPSFIRATAIGPDGTEVPFPIQAMPAPINDSIYVPQNSQWYRYAEMWNSGYTDNLWLRLLQRSRGKEQPVL